MNRDLIELLTRSFSFNRRAELSMSIGHTTTQFYSASGRSGRLGTRNAKCIRMLLGAFRLRITPTFDRDIWCPMDGLHLNSLHSSLDCWWTIERGIDRQPEMDTSPYRLDCTDHFRTAQDRTIDFSDTTRSLFRDVSTRT